MQIIEQWKTDEGRLSAIFEAVESNDFSCSWQRVGDPPWGNAPERGPVTGLQASACTVAVQSMRYFIKVCALSEICDPQTCPGCKFG